MIMITGGKAQGKIKYAVEKLNVHNIADGSVCDIHEIYTSECVVNYHEIVKRLLDVGEDPETFTKNFCRNSDCSVIVMDEIGSGIIPLEKSERIWREAAGRCGCIIAGMSETVIRMTCGIASAIKRELP